MEAARRQEELAPEERQVLINDVLTQLDELQTRWPTWPSWPG